MSIKSMVLHSGFRLSMMHYSGNGLIFTKRFRKFAEFEKVFKAEHYKAWDGNICLKEGESNKEHGFF